MQRSWTFNRIKSCLLAACLAALPPVAASAQPAKAPIKPTELDLKTIQDAIAKAVAALYRMEPTYTFPPEQAYAYAYNQEAFHAMGNHALAIWALLAAGESYQNPPLYRRLNWVLSSDAPYTYDRGMRATMLHELPRARWGPWIHRDGLWLAGDGTLKYPGALSDVGNFTDTYLGLPIKGPGDNANGQYGVLGLWNIDRAGYPIRTQVWEKIDKYWRKAQQKTATDLAAGWGVYSQETPAAGGQAEFYGRVSGPMTAGAVSALALTERYLKGPTLLDPKKENVSIELRKGLRWLDENFSLDDKAEASDWFFYMWTIQRVGGATGYRTFHNVDWFRQVTARILNQQQADGTWNGDKGVMLSTGFAVLYLSKANDPLAIAKIRFKTTDKNGNTTEGAWNNRPHDIWNFADYASDEYECATTWQIAELTQPPYELMESPLLYLATDQNFSLGETEINNLRAYLNAGGLLICNAEDTKGEALRGFRDLAGKLYPGKEFRPVPKTHPLYNVHQAKLAGVDMQMIDDGIRPLALFFPRDISRELQANNLSNRAFGILSNTYLYATGMNPRRTRLESNFVVQNVERPRQPLAVARIKHSGKYDPEVGALTQLKAIVANKCDIDLQISEVTPEQLGPSQKMAFLTTMGDGQLTDAEGAAIQKWVADGGTLWLDAAGGSDAARKISEDMLHKIVPGKIPVPLAPDDPILSGRGLPHGTDNKRVKFRLYALSKMLPTASPRIQSVEVNNRKGIYYSGEDLTCGLAGLDHWGIFGYTSEFARRLVVNGVEAVLRGPAPELPAPPPGAH